MELGSITGRRGQHTGSVTLRGRTTDLQLHGVLSSSRCLLLFFSLCLFLPYLVAVHVELSVASLLLLINVQDRLERNIAVLSSEYSRRFRRLYGNGKCFTQRRFFLQTLSKTSGKA